MTQPRSARQAGSPKGHKVVVVKQDPDQVGPGPGGCIAALCRFGQFFPLVRCPSHRGVFRRARLGTQEHHERQIGRTRRSSAEPPRVGSRRVSRSAIGRAASSTSWLFVRRQRLLRHDALLAAVALLHQRLVKCRQEQISLVIGVEKVEAAPGGLCLGRGWDRRPAHRRVERPGQGQDRIADDLRLQPARRPPPELRFSGSFAMASSSPPTTTAGKPPTRRSVDADASCSSRSR